MMNQLILCQQFIYQLFLNAKQFMLKVINQYQSIMQRLRQFFMSTQQIYISTTYSFQPQSTPQDLLQALFANSKTSQKQMNNFINLVHTKASKSAIDRLRILSIINLLLLYNIQMPKYVLQILPLKQHKVVVTGNFKKKKQTALGISTNEELQSSATSSTILNNNQDWLDENFIKPYQLLLVKCTSEFELYNSSKNNRTWNTEGRKAKDDFNCFRTMSNSCCKSEKQKGRMYNNSCEKDYKQIKSKNFLQRQSETNNLSVVNFEYIFYLVNSIKALLHCFQRISSLGHYFTRSIYSLQANAESDLNSKLFVRIALMQISDFYSSLVYSIKEMLKSPSKFLSKTSQQVIMKAILEQTLPEINENVKKVISNKYFEESNRTIKIKLFIIDEQNELIRTVAKSVLRSKYQSPKHNSINTTNKNRNKSAIIQPLKSSADLFGEFQQKTKNHRKNMSEESSKVVKNADKKRKKSSKPKSKITIDLSKLHLPSSKQLCQGQIVLGSSSNMKKIRYLQKLKLKKLSTLDQMLEEDIQESGETSKKFNETEYTSYQQSTLTNDSLGLSRIKRLQVSSNYP